MVRNIKLASIFFLVVASIVFGMLLAEGLDTDLLDRVRASVPGTGGDGRILGTTALAASEPALPSFAEVVERVNPSVVFVGVTEVGKRQAMPRGPHGEDFFEFFPPGEGDEQDEDFRREGGGSGFVIDAEGWILTNNHVIQDATTVTVKLSDDREFTAEVRGTDPILDVALLKIDAKANLPVAVLGDSESLRAGDWVLAIGNPFVYEHTVTAGVVSHKGRANAANPFSRFIQTDAAINFGNSGGPLLNVRGEVVGINTAISAVGQNIGFAIPINNVKAIMGQLKEKGKVARGFLGVSPQDFGPLKEAFRGIGVEKGALVVDVEKDSPADAAGIQVDDVIVKVGDTPITTREELFNVVGSTSPGTKIAITVVREEKKGRWAEKVLSATLRERDDRPGAEGQEEEQPPAPQLRPGMKLGLRVEPLTPQARRQMRLPDDANGIVVTHVFARGPAAEAGVAVGDVITEVNGTPITSGGDLAAILEEAAEGTVLRVRIYHQGRPRVVPITVKTWQTPE